MPDLDKNNTLQTDVSENTQLAFSALKCSFTTVSEQFSDRERCVINCQNDEVKNRMMGISFDTATLTCHFNKNDVCHNAYLYLDDLGHLQHYVDYFNQVYKFDPVCQAWVTDKGCIYLEADGMDCYMSLQSLDANRSN